MCTVVIAAHNEASVIGACLDSVLRDAEPGEFDVIVAANGCTDATTEVARERGVTVLDLPEAGKAGALNAADAVATSCPRIYLDADVQLTTAAVRALRDAVSVQPAGRQALAAAARRELQLGGRPLAVRAYYAVNRRHPAYRSSLIGRGAIALSREGRSRFDRFPRQHADDLFLDCLFSADEKVEVFEARSVLATPWRTRDLLRRLVRVRRANRQLRLWDPSSAAPSIRSSDRLAWLRHVVVPHPWLAPAAAVYAGITLTAEILASRSADEVTWGRDESTRSADGRR